jgi:dihydroorotate dehydrogenase electron transfer subunit
MSDPRGSVASPERHRLPVLAAREVGAYRVIACPDPLPAPWPGQFYMLAAVEGWGGGAGERPYLPRAFSVLRARGGRLEFLLEDVGPGTRRLAALEPGDELWVLGPLGLGFAPPPDGRRAVLAGGGAGIAPLAIWQDELRAGGDDPLVLVGFRDAAHAAGATLLDGAALATDDGSVGHHGPVTELLAATLEADEPVAVYACGPPPMLEAVRRLCAQGGTPAQLALESGMACGFGACFGCVVATREGYRRVCVDGPVFDAAALETALAGPGQ